MYESSLFITFLKVACGPCWAIVSRTFLTWSGRARTLPSSESLASPTFIISVPAEMSENSVRTSTPPGPQRGTGASTTASSPLL